MEHNIPTQFGNVVIKQDAESRWRVYFLNDSLHYGKTEDALFLFLPTVVNQLLPSLKEAIPSWRNYYYTKYVNKTLLTQTMYSTDRHQNVQKRILLTLGFMDGELQFRLREWRRRYLSHYKYLKPRYGEWVVRYGSFRLDPIDVELLQPRLTALLTSLEIENEVPLKRCRRQEEEEEPSALFGVTEDTDSVLASTMAQVFI